MEQLIERIAKAPTGNKIAVVALALAVMTAVNYFVTGVPFGGSIQATEQKITRTVGEQHRLDGEFIEKQAIANDLNRFRREREMLEQRLHEALAELPESKNLDELLQQFQDRAQKAGLEIASVIPQAPVSAGFHVRIPIDMKVTGTYHEIATFLDAVGRLRRIVNVSDLTLDAPKDMNGKVILASSFTATTFMFADTKGETKKVTQ
jgi:type IV pilus assembly protein PilO